MIMARANSFNQVIAGQVVAAVLFINQPIISAVASEILPRKLRPAAQGGLNAAGALGAIVAFLAGTALSEQSLFGWRNIWYICAGIMGASGIIIAALYRPVPLELQRSMTTGHKLGRLDWVGYVLLAAALVPICMGFSWAESPYSWKNSHVVAPLVIGFVMLVVFVIHQVFVNKHGLLDHDLFSRDRNFAISIAAFFADGMVFWAYTAHTPVELSILFVEKPLVQGVRLAIPFFAAIFAVALIPLISRFTSFIREPIVASFLFYVIYFGRHFLLTSSAKNTANSYQL